MAREVIAAISMAALVVALGCARRHERRAGFEAPPPATTTAPAPTARGGGPIATTPDAALTQTYLLDANAPLAEPIAGSKADAQADGPSGGTYGASSDDKSPGAQYESQPRAGIDQPNSVNGP